MKISPVRYHFQSSFEFCMGRGFHVRSFMSELNKSLHERTSLRQRLHETESVWNWYKINMDKARVYMGPGGLDLLSDTKWIHL